MDQETPLSKMRVASLVSLAVDLYRERPPQWSRSEEVAAPWQASREDCVDPTRRILVIGSNVGRGTDVL